MVLCLSLSAKWVCSLSSGLFLVKYIFVSILYYRKRDIYVVGGFRKIQSMYINLCISSHDYDNVQDT